MIASSVIVNHCIVQSLVSCYDSSVDYSYLDTDDKILAAVAEWESKDRIAVDFEGEFNLHIYGEHLCLIQVYDGEGYFIIDPRSQGVTVKALKAFFLSSVEKVWFDAQSDASLVHKNYDTAISSIFDIRILAMVLGYTGNLTGLEEKYLGVKREGSGSKKRNQRANWLHRPLPESQIEYALEDVEYLLALKDVLVPLVRDAGLEEKAMAEMKRALQVKTPKPGWKKIGDWRKLSRREKIYVKNIFIARDKIARRFNVPASFVMDKRLIVTLASDPPDNVDRLSAVLRGQSQRFMKLLVPSLWEALERSAEESSGIK